MMLTQLDRIVLFAIAAGFISGLFQFMLDYILKSNTERQADPIQKFVGRMLYLCFTYSVIIAAMTFALEVWNTSMSATRLNRFSIAMAVWFGIMPLHDRLWSFIFAKLKKTS